MFKVRPPRLRNRLLVRRHLSVLLFEEDPPQPVRIYAVGVIFSEVAAATLGAEERGAQPHLGVEHHVPGLVGQPQLVGILSVEFGDEVVFREIYTSDRKVFLEWGISDALFIDNKEVRTGPPPSYEKIKKLIAKRVKKS